jgi:caffeoyl-CoA O-methyltransferase
LFAQFIFSPLLIMPELAYIGRFDGTNSKHASPAMAAAGAGASASKGEDITNCSTSTKWSVLSSRIEGLAMEMCQVVGGMDAYCVSMSNAEGPAMKAVREKMLATNWAEEWESKRTMFSYGEEMSTDPLEAMMLKQFVHMQQPKRILEVGMFVGFGATAMMEGSPNAEVVSLEIDPYLKKWLSDCLEKFPDFLKRHEVMVGPALASLPKLTGQFDMVFVDANKSEYKRYVEVMLEKDLIAPGGTIFCDNILYNGYPYLNSHFDSQPARRAFGNDIKEFNQWVCDHPELEQVVLPIRDGVSIIRKKPTLSCRPEIPSGDDAHKVDVLTKQLSERDARIAELEKKLEQISKLAA